MKVGDRVEIIGGDSDKHNDWLSEMDDYIGEEATILVIHRDDDGIMFIELDIADNSYAWSPQWLKKV